MQELSGDYIAGFVDGEGCFALKFRRDIRHERKNKPVYFYWDIEFAIELRQDDRGLLEKIQATLECGRINVNRRGVARYSVQRIEDLNSIIVPFFTKHRLYGKKQHDFGLWKEATSIFQRNQRQELNIQKGKRGFCKTMWNPKDLKRLIEIHKEMKQYKSKREEWKWLSGASS